MSQLKIYLPPPINWQDLQSLVKDIAACRYDPNTVVEYGRLGQKQNGVDVYAEDLFGKKIGIQCKETKQRLTLNTVIKDANDAKNFLPALDIFIVATTARTDSELQSDVMTLNSGKSYPFTIKVEFWDDLTNDINRYARVLNDCYETFRSTFMQSDESNHLACLRVAFDRPAFKDNFLHERNYDEFEEALTSTKRLFRTGFTMDRWSRIPVVQTVPAEYLPDGEYRKFVLKIEQLLEKIYKAWIRDKQKFLQNYQYAEDRAGHYNILRRDLLTELNAKFMAEALPKINFSYF